MLVHCLFTGYSQPITCPVTRHCLFAFYSQSILSIHCLFTVYFLPIHCMYDYCIDVIYIVDIILYATTFTVMREEEGESERGFIAYAISLLIH